MFHSSKIGDSPQSDKNSLHKSFNDTANGIPRSFLQPKITSTPLVRRESIFATPPKPHLLSPRRYSLSEIATPPRTSKRDISKIHSSGPLLASTRYNLNVSTYEDTKSPGLAGRIVQYNEEAQKEKERQRLPTHQAKYGSPGLFPVVHLFKKKLPPLEQKPRSVTIRIASPEYSRHHPQEYNRKLLEGIIKPNSSSSTRRMFSSPSGEGNNSSTRSVLEALKEISRKRIHANEEYELNEDSSKRIRTDNVSETDSNKRLRDDSPLLDTSSSPNKSSSKRICMYDEYAASCSSMNFSLKKSEQPTLKRKSISISTTTEDKKEPDRAKLVNAETQTILSEPKNDQENKISTEKVSETTTTQNQGGKDQDKDKENPIQIFTDVPLERIRKNRLAALMGSLAGKETTETPLSNYSTLISNSTDTPDNAQDPSKTNDKPLISILSSSKKDSPHRSNKHVHFNVPESMSQPNLTAPAPVNFSLTKSSTSITSPISSTCEAQSSFGSNKGDKLETPAPPSSPVGLTPCSSETTVTVPAVAFGTNSNSSSATSVVSKESSISVSSVNTSKSDTAIPNLQFKFPTTSATSLGTNAPSLPLQTSMSATQIGFGASTTPQALTTTTSATSSPKVGGFKFDLAKPVTASSSTTSTTSSTSIALTTSVPSFNFGAPAQDASKSNPLFGNISTTPAVTTQPSLSTSGTFAFGARNASSGANTTTSSTFGTVTTPSSLSTSAPPSFKFGNTETKPVTGFGTNNSGLNFGSTSVQSTVPSFGTTTTVVSTSAPSFGNTKAPVFSFGAPSTTSTTMTGFGAATTSAAPISFGTPSSTAAAGFGAPTIGAFGVPTTSQSVSFAATTTASSGGGFGATPATSGSTFGNSSATPMFGSNKPVSPFGASTTSAAIPFGTTTTSTNMPFGTSTSISPFNKTSTGFGQTTAQPAFGTPTTTASFGTANAFEKTSTTSSSVFGSGTNPSGFGKQQSPKPLSGTGSIFGGAVNTQPSAFGGTNSKPVFGGNNASPFGSSTPATSAPAFGNTSSATFNFGAKTTASSSFGGSFGTTTTTASTGFGAATPAFGASNSFGSGSTFGNTNAFGNSAAPAFGAASTTTPAFGAVNTTTPAFGAVNTTAPAFGAVNTTTPAFGANSNIPSFGAVTTQSAFGTSNAAPAFGSPNVGFGGSTTPSFGATPAPSFNSTAPTTGFGAPNNSSGFGTNANASAFAKPQTGFGTTPNNSFGGGGGGFGNNQQPTSGFGASNPNSQTPVFSFGGATGAKPAGVFSFGAAPSNEPLKPSFNFTGGSAAPAFGSSAPPAFGNTGTPAFGGPGVAQFNAPQPAAPGMFSIGSGSTSGRTRTQLRAKRRT